MVITAVILLHVKESEMVDDYTSEAQGMMDCDFGFNAQIKECEVCEEEDCECGYII